MNLGDINMVKALIDISEHSNRVLNVVKAKHGFKDKSEAIDFVVEIFEEDIMDPELRPEFIEKMKRIEKQKSISVRDFAKRYGLK